MSLLLICSALMLGLPSDRDAYEAAKAKVGSGSEANAALALWCEAHGLQAERMKHLAIAVLADPKNAVARGLMGMVSYGGEWRTPDQVGRRERDDSALAAKLPAYNAKRTTFEAAIDRERTHEERLMTGGNFVAANDRLIADGHVRLAMWCESNGLKGEALTHFNTVVHLDPYREATWKHLGCVKHNGQWMTREQAAAADKEAPAQRSDREANP